MKHLFLLIFAVLAFFSAKAQNGIFTSYGNSIDAYNAIEKDELRSKFTNLKEGDTIDVKFTSKINSVCKKKGCWMKLDLGEGKEAMVRFKDYGFFVPKDADNKTTVVNGKAFITVMTVAKQKHYAKDAGKSAEEIAKITEPKITYAITADGVLIN